MSERPGDATFEAALFRISVALTVIGGLTLLVMLLLAGGCS